MRLAGRTQKMPLSCSACSNWPDILEGTQLAAGLVMARRPRSRAVIVTERVSDAIVIARGQRVLLDADLAALYQVDIKSLNQAVKRNVARFPVDFMFRLDAREAESLRSRIVTLKRGRGRHRKYLPYAFTEQGVAMLSSVLRSSRAVSVNIEIMRVFVRLRHELHANGELARRIDRLETKYDGRFAVVFQAIRELVSPPVVPRRRIGYLQVR
jgi:ORF6N domain